jgi:hypothetical protein
LKVGTFWLKKAFHCSIPTPASILNGICGNGLGNAESQWLTVWLTNFGLLYNCSQIREMTALHTAANQSGVHPENSPKQSLEARSRENRKRRPDLNRPW